ncbi:MAG: class I SAM-dependent methyltransferase [Alphaproteobacteria bacterium]
MSQASVCRVCGAAPGAPFARKDGYDFARCGQCGFVYLDPMPTSEALATLYDGGTSGGISADAYPKADSRLRRARIRALRFVHHLRGRDALDIGCGGGFMTEAMGGFGARAVGVDIDPQAIAYASRRFPRRRFFDQNFDDFATNGLTFDFVHASEVMEHVPDIGQFMAVLAKITRPGGRVFITTPDIGHRRVPADVTAWDMFSPPTHVQFFDRTTITILFERHGFRIRRRFFKLKPGLQILAEKV